MDCWENQSWNQEKQLVSVDIFTLNRKVYLASKASANTPAASGAAADVPECVLVHFPYKSVVACVKRKVYNRRVWQSAQNITSSGWKKKNILYDHFTASLITVPFRFMKDFNILFKLITRW